MELENVTVVRARANEMIEAIAGASGVQGGNRGNGNARNGKGGRNGRGAVARGPVLDLDGKPIQARHPFAVVTWSCRCTDDQAIRGRCRCLNAVDVWSH